VRWTSVKPAALPRLPCWPGVTAVVAAVIVLAACGSASGLRPRPHSRAAAHQATPAPSVGEVAETAFAGHGELAFVSRGQLWVLDGATGTLRRVTTPGMTALDPQFSRDGRWLAFLGSSASPPAPAYTVWLASGDGGGAREILASGGLIGWSPAADLLAVTTADTIRLVGPSGSARTLARAPGVGSGVWPGVGSAVWSPDGRSLAVSQGSPSSGSLTSYPVAGGRPTVWLRLTAQEGSGNNLIDPAGWWPHQGIGYWAVGDCDSCNADGDPFYVIPSPGAHPRRLGSTLADGGLDQVAAAPDGQLAIVAETPGPGMGGRVIWQDRAVQVCGLRAAGCASIPSPASTVTLDPAWSPAGGTLALVRGPYLASVGFPQNAVAAWYDAHQLWLYDPAHGSLRELDASGASVPTWAADGKSLLYVADDGLWLLPSLSGRPVPIAGPLFPPDKWPSFYGQVNWLGQFAWWPG
jgi:dipeptidyl aminopeptidase/acylaminoacyl peptidase